jgi:hypothetical protein
MISRRTFIKAIATISAGLSPLSALWGGLWSAKTITAEPRQAVQTSHGYGTGAYGVGTYPQPHVYVPIVGVGRS